MLRGTSEQQRGSRRLLASITAALGVLVLAPPTATAQSPTNCPTAPWNELSVAHEIIDIGTVLSNPRIPLATYKDGGDNPIPGEVWDAGYEPPSPYIANTTRNLQFNESQFIASPGEPVCETRYITTSDGYTWAAMSTAVNAMWPYRKGQYSGLAARNTYYAGNLVETPPPAVVKLTANFKAQNMKFWANEDGVAPGTPGAVPLPRYFVRDRWGNEYVMHASGGGTPEEVAQAFEDAVLPGGWRRLERTLDEDLILRPAVGSDGSYHYLVIRDSADNTYHQYKWSRRGSLQARVEGRAMPIWGGQGGDLLTGTRGADVIHGAGGNDTIRPRMGRDVVWGDAGFDTVVLPGRSWRYRLLRMSKDRRTLVIRGFGSRQILNYVERLRFADKIVRVKSLRRSHVGKPF